LGPSLEAVVAVGIVVAGIVAPVDMMVLGTVHLELSVNN
jgi:hypothetical protein